MALHVQNIYIKITKFDPKILQHGSQNLLKLVPNSSLERVLGGSCWMLVFCILLSSFLHPLRGILERTWPPSWTQVGPSWEQVGPSWGQDAPCWRQVGPSWRQSCPSWRQNGAKMSFQRVCVAFSKDVQTCIDFSTHFGSIFHGFLIPRNLNFSDFVLCFTVFFQKITFFHIFLYVLKFLSIFGANMTLKIHQKSKI